MDDKQVREQRSIDPYDVIVRIENLEEEIALLRRQEANQHGRPHLDRLHFVKGLNDRPIMCHCEYCKDRPF